MIDRGHKLPLTRQSQILELSRSSLYYKAVPISLLDIINENLKMANERIIKENIQTTRHDTENKL